MSKTEEAVNALSELGLTEYEARCFVALTKVSTGTAKEISQISDVPRSRVYDTIERLERKGLVDVQQSEPREYRSVDVETATRRIRENYDSRINAAENALEQIDSPEATEDAGVWSISRTEHVTDRIVTFLDEAEQSIHFLIASDDVLDDRVQEHLRRAADRDVTVVIEVPSEDVAETFAEAVPGATVTVSPDLGSPDPVYSEWPGQLLLVDEESVVTAAVKEANLPDVVQQTAIWTYGHDHGLAVWVHELLDDRRTVRELDD